MKKDNPNPITKGKVNNNHKKRQKQKKTRALEREILAILDENPDKKFTSKNILDRLNAVEGKEYIKEQVAKSTGKLWDKGRLNKERGRLFFKEQDRRPAIQPKKVEIVNDNKPVQEKQSAKPVRSKKTHRKGPRPSQEKTNNDNNSNNNNDNRENNNRNSRDQQKRSKNSRRNDRRKNDRPSNDRSNNRQRNNNDRQNNSPRSIVEGIVDMTRSGSAFIICEGLDKDVFVPAFKLKNALNGDQVKVKTRIKKGGKRNEGEVIEITKRNQDQFVGLIKISKTFAFLIPDNPNMKMDLFIPKNKIKGAQNGDKVLVKVLEWPSADGKKPVSEVVEVLGAPGGNDVEMKSILVDNGFSLSFPDEVLAQAAALPTKISAKEIAKRRDLRDVPTLTIDPHDAKDFDDALSMQQLPNGNWEVGIHIADVTHYARPNTAMDDEAYKRATSVYLVDRVLPMYPENLSNMVCSLRPHEEKLCFSAIFELDENAKILSEWFGRAVIYSDRRFSYEEAQEVIDTGKGDLAKEVVQLNKLALKLREQRMVEGSINFGSVDVKFVLDEEGKPIDILLKEPKASNKMIEDFMLLANRSVAKFMNNKVYKGKKVPTINRIHAMPDNEKLADFAKFAARFGYRLDLTNEETTTDSLNKLLEKVKGKPEQTLLETLAIRSMSKAAYSTQKDVGHYGLAFKDYTHFTSPIRRYPDVMVHRILAECLAEKPKYEMDENEVEHRCQHTSMMERKALTAERASIKYKQVEYMSERLGEEFVGVISGVKHFGFFVELEENKCEGMIRLENLKDDHYQFDESQHVIFGLHKGKRYQLGGKVNVRVANTDQSARTIDFELV